MATDEWTVTTEQLERLMATPIEIPACVPESVYVRLLGWRTPAFRAGDWCVVSTHDEAAASDPSWVMAHANGLAAIENDPDVEEPRLALNTLRVAIAGAREYARANYAPTHRGRVTGSLMDRVHAAMVREWERENGGEDAN